MVSLLLPLWRFDVYTLSGKTLSGKSDEISAK